MYYYALRVRPAACQFPFDHMFHVEQSSQVTEDNMSSQQAGGGTYDISVVITMFL